MTFKEIQELIKLINKSNLSEFKIRQGEFEMSIRTKSYSKMKSKHLMSAQPTILPVSPPTSPVAAPATTSTPAEAPAAPSEAEPQKEATPSNLLEVKSPIVGTFYRSASPDKPPYVKVGDVVEEGSIVCIVEAMKLFNEIESEVSGKIVKVLVDDASPVEYDQVLFLVDPNG